MNVIFAGTPASSAKILKKMHSDGINIKLVISQPDKRSKRGSKEESSDVSKEANDLGLDLIKPIDLNSKELKKMILSLNIDFLVVSAYGKIIPEWLLNHPTKLALNVHFSLLPKYRGASPIQSVLVNGDNETGISFMEMNQFMDEGDIIKMLSIEIDENENKATLENKLSDLAANNITEVLNNIIENKFRLSPQENGQASYCSKIHKTDGEINFEDSSEVILRKFNAYKGWPGTYFLHHNIIIKVHEMHIDNNMHDGVPGTILEITNDGITIKTSNSSIVITHIQFPNKKIISSVDAFNSYLEFFTN